MPIGFPFDINTDVANSPQVLSSDAIGVGGSDIVSPTSNASKKQTIDLTLEEKSIALNVVNPDVEEHIWESIEKND